MKSRGVVFSILFTISLFFLAGCPQVADEEVAEPKIACETGSDCIIVDSIRCQTCDCKEAINKEDLEFWNELLVIHKDDACDTLCEPCVDGDVKGARCVDNVCEKVFPDYVPDERVYGMPPAEQPNLPLLPPVGSSGQSENNPPEDADIPSLPALPIPGDG